MTLLVAQGMSRQKKKILVDSEGRCLVGIFGGGFYILVECLIKTEGFSQVGLGEGFS